MRHCTSSLGRAGQIREKPRIYRKKLFGPSVESMKALHKEERGKILAQLKLQQIQREVIKRNLVLWNSG